MNYVPLFLTSRQREMFYINIYKNNNQSNQCDRSEALRIIFTNKDTGLSFLRCCESGATWLSSA